MPLKYTWLPASKPNVLNPIKIKNVDGPYLITDKGQVLYDAISSWWCKPLGHKHDIVLRSITQQLSIFDHHIHADTYNDLIEELSYRLIKPFKDINKVMYASDGSSAIEIAMKLSYKVRILTKEPNRHKFIALKGAYHGETGLALSVCGLEDFKHDYVSLLLKNYFINDIPYVSSRLDQKWFKCNFDYSKMDSFFAKVAKEVTALIIEPIVQGASGFKIISQDFLVHLIKLAQKYSIHVISDEIMVGLGRLGYLSVTKSILNYEPEFICFAKNLTAGSVPMSATLINQEITKFFTQKNITFEHSHTHSCNTLATKVAISYLKLLDESQILNDVIQIEAKLMNLVNYFASVFEFVINPRAIGSILACDLNVKKHILQKIFQIGINHGIYLRLLGNTLYITPPIYQLDKDFNEIATKLSMVLEQIRYEYLR